MNKFVYRPRGQASPPGMASSGESGGESSYYTFYTCTMYAVSKTAQFLSRDAMHKRGHVVMRCLSDCHVRSLHSVETNKSIFKIFAPSGFGWPSHSSFSVRNVVALFRR